VVPIAALLERLRLDLIDWRSVQVASLLFGRRSVALAAVTAFLSLAVGLLLIRLMWRRPRGQDQIVVPAILATDRLSSFSLVRHVPLLLFLAGVPLFMLALADPYTTIAEQQVSYPGRRIALLIDASSSMLKPFAAGRLNPHGPNQAAFFTSVGAAEAFIRQRRNGKYRDLIALIEFGDEAYVITPFTSDYDNVLLSASLIGDWGEFMRFPNQGTKIAAAIEEGTTLFQAFNFLNASGNLLIIFSDGEDTQVTLHGRSLNDILVSAVSNRIPVYMVRTNRDKHLGDIVPDSIWKSAVENTGGRFYAAATESDVIRAIEEIDVRSPGKIQMKQYSANQLRFVPFAVAAITLWSVALVLKLTLPQLTKFP
jgi:Ca-activated chloride channel family protein